MVRLSLLTAIQFLTRVPIRTRREPDVAASVVWFPVVGALIGAGVGGVAAGLWHVVPPLVAAAVAVVLGVLITGAFHEDGLADVADAFAGGTTVERRLEILKDSRHGSYGVAAAVVGWWAAPLAAVVVVTVVAVRWLSLRKIAGISGDVLGTCEQIAECLCFVVLTGLAAHHTLWQ